MLTAHQLHIDGRRHTLLPSTTLEARRGQVLLVQADGQERRTALVLALTGRMKPTTGTVTLGHDDSMTSLRRRSAVVDAPEVNAPEYHLSVRSLASEDLALVPRKFRARTRPTEWLITHGFRDILDQWVEELSPNRLLHLQLELALANPDVDLLVIDSPDRHTADVGAWLPLLQQAAAGELGHGPDLPADTPPRLLLVVGVLARLPDGWDGPAVLVGNTAVTETVVADPGAAETVLAEKVLSEAVLAKTSTAGNAAPENTAPASPETTFATVTPDPLEPPEDAEDDLNATGLLSTVETTTEVTTTVIDGATEENK